MPILLIAIILGIVEGVTEFLPVSSTGHLILATELLGFDAEKWAAFNVIIQLGAILAIVVLYWRTFWAVLEGIIRGNPVSWRFVRNILIGFLPSAILGFLLIKNIEALLGNATVVAVAFIVGGIAILAAERWRPAPRVREVDDMRVGTALGIGCFQLLAMIPGMSRAGSTIIGALLLGVDRKPATEFSFFLAIPTIIGAAVLDMWKNRAELSSGDFLVIAIGFVTSFVFALIVVRTLVGFVSRHGFGVFAWYRIAAGILALVLLLGLH